MGITVMIIMGLLSVLAISSIDFDGLDELRERYEEAKAEQEQEEEFQDTSELGWLDVDDDSTPNDLFNTDLLSFASNETADTSLGANAVGLAAETEDTGDDFNSFGDFDFEGLEDEEATQFSTDAANDLWPLEAQSEEDETEEEESETEQDELIELVGFNAQEDALELPYNQKEDGDGNVIPPEVAVSHHDGWTEVNVDGETLSFSHTVDSNFKGLEPEDVLLRAA